MTEEITCKTGFPSGLIDEETFERELGLCKKLSQKREGKCNWGECAKCGVVPLLYKLHKGELYEEEKAIGKLKDAMLKSQD